MKMDALLNQLLDLLHQESETYRSMVTVLDREKDAVVRSELTGLNAAIREKENLLLKLRMLETQRGRVVTKLADTLGYASRNLTLRMIAQRVDGLYAGRLKKCSAELEASIGALETANRRNQELVEHSLLLVRGSFNLLNDLTTSDTVYHRSGGVQNKNSTGRLVRGEI